MISAATGMSARRLAWVGWAVGMLAASAWAENNSSIWKDDFDTDPFSRWAFDTGPGDGFGDNSYEQFICDLESGELVVDYDSSKPTVRLQRPLGRSFTETHAFTFSATLRFDSIVAPDEDYMQICLALTNDATTGAQRSVPYPEPANTFDNIELDYFPNLSQFFGGPFVTVTVQGSQQNPELDAYQYLSFAAVEHELPTGVELKFSGHYDPRTTTLHFRVNDEVALETDITEQPQFGNPAERFTVDQFSITTYFDGADYFPQSTSLLATVAYDEAEFAELGDGNEDGQIDFLDFGVLQRCYTGPGGSDLSDECVLLDFNGDDDVDLGDFATFEFVRKGES